MKLNGNGILVSHCANTAIKLEENKIDPIKT